MGGPEENQSTWLGFRKKVRVLLPYMWPRGNTFLQLLVVFCLTLLGIERVVNVFVPIYYKNIGEGPISLPDPRTPRRLPNSLLGLNGPCLAGKLSGALIVLIGCVM